MSLPPKTAVVKPYPCHTTFQTGMPVPWEKVSASESVRGDSFGTCGMCPPGQLSSERAARDRYRFTRGAVFVRSKSRYEDHIGHLDAVFLFSAVFNKTYAMLTLEVV